MIDKLVSNKPMARCPACRQSFSLTPRGYYPTHYKPVGKRSKVRCPRSGTKARAVERRTLTEPPKLELHPTEPAFTAEAPWTNYARVEPPPPPAPIPMLMWCPECGGRHVDVGDFALKEHHTHACQHCGHVWRPAIVPTVGVQFLPGYRNGGS